MAVDRSHCANVIFVAVPKHMPRPSLGASGLRVPFILCLVVLPGQKTIEA